MKKRKKKLQDRSVSSSPSAIEGFSALVDTYTEALNENSNMIEEMLTELTKRELSDEDKKTLQNIEKQLEQIDKDIIKLGK